MPELPEVETIRRTLNPLIRGAKIVRVQVLDRRLRIPVALDFESRLVNKVIANVRRKGKYLLVGLDSDWVWVIHLGMAGKLIYLASGLPRDRHDHIIVEFTSGYELRFHDPRRFGLSIVIRERDLGQWPSLSRLGEDPLGLQWSSTYLHSVMRRSRRRLRDLLLDQRLIAGLGNIYANEALFQVGLRPTRRARTVNSKLTQQMAVAIPRVLREAIRWRGTSFSDYRDGKNRKGEFQNHLKVYNREGKPCHNCSGKIKRVRMGNRSAFYCPTCQS